MYIDAVNFKLGARILRLRTKGIRRLLQILFFSCLISAKLIFAGVEWNQTSENKIDLLKFLDIAVGQIDLGLEYLNGNNDDYKAILDCLKTVEGYHKSLVKFLKNDSILNVCQMKKSDRYFKKEYCDMGRCPNGNCWNFENPWRDVCCDRCCDIQLDGVTDMNPVEICISCSPCCYSLECLIRPFLKSSYSNGRCPSIGCPLSAVPEVQEIKSHLESLKDNYLTLRQWLEKKKEKEEDSDSDSDSDTQTYAMEPSLLLKDEHVSLLSPIDDNQLLLTLIKREISQAKTKLNAGDENCMVHLDKIAKLHKEILSRKVLDKFFLKNFRVYSKNDLNDINYFECASLPTYQGTSFEIDDTWLMRFWAAQHWVHRDRQRRDSSDHFRVFWFGSFVCAGGICCYSLQAVASIFNPCNYHGGQFCKVGLPYSSKINMLRSRMFVDTLDLLYSSLSSNDEDHVTVEKEVEYPSPCAPIKSESMDRD